MTKADMITALRPFTDEAPILVVDALGCAVEARLEYNLSPYKGPSGGQGRLVLVPSYLTTPGIHDGQTLKLT